MTGERNSPRGNLALHQLAQLRKLLGALLDSNPFYGPRLRKAGLEGELSSLDEFTGSLPLTCKEELVEDQSNDPPYGTNLTYPLEAYSRFHQTSGTSGSPLRWLDTPDSWRWMLQGWRKVFEVAAVGPEDRVLFPFSFGPFLGFWTAFDAAEDLGCLALPGGSLSSQARLRLLEENQATVVCCTPTYALRLAEVAAQVGFDLATSSVTRLIVAGEPGGSVPAVRRRISQRWGGAKVLDHHGMTEVGPVSFPNAAHPDILHIFESSYLAEILDPTTLQPVTPGEVGELVLTTLGRLGSPLLRYRTGDLVQQSLRPAEELGHPELALQGGLLARADDMVVVRGVNLYPSAVERVVRGFEEVAEYRVELSTEASLAEVRLLVEPAPGVSGAKLSQQLATALRNSFQLRIPVSPVATGSLPRFELKAQRWVRED
ncbi:MAG: AMP-binding protein [Deltaproteobacteria bacterium]|nr:AMP-binding protein [Deltaproteobacteria bacterium]